MSPPPERAARVPDGLAGVVARLALRQQNLRTLMPVLLHDVNGSLNGLSLAIELLSRVGSGSPDAGNAASGAPSLMQRSRSELARLKASLKAMETRVAPGGAAGPGEASRTPLAPLQREVQALLMPAMRRSQLEWRIAGEVADDARVVLRADECFDYLAGFAIIALEGAQVGSTLEVHSRVDAGRLALCISHDGTVQPGLGLELHRELLRAALAGTVEGEVQWSRAGGRNLASLWLPASRGED